MDDALVPGLREELITDALERHLSSYPSRPQTRISLWLMPRR